MEAGGTARGLETPQSMREKDARLLQKMKAKGMPTDLVTLQLLREVILERDRRKQEEEHTAAAAPVKTDDSSPASAAHNVF